MLQVGPFEDLIPLCAFLGTFWIYFRSFMPKRALWSFFACVSGTIRRSFLLHRKPRSRYLHISVLASLNYTKLATLSLHREEQNCHYTGKSKIVITRGRAKLSLHGEEQNCHYTGKSKIVITWGRAKLSLHGEEQNCHYTGEEQNCHYMRKSKIVITQGRAKLSLHGEEKIVITWGRAKLSLHGEEQNCRYMGKNKINSSKKAPTSIEPRTCCSSL